MARLLRDQGKLDEAEPLHRRAMAGYEAKLGLDHPSTLTSVNNLALLLENQGKLDEADRRALAGYESKLGPDHPDTLTTVNTLANLLRIKASWMRCRGGAVCCLELMQLGTDILLSQQCRQQCCYVQTTLVLL